MVGALVWAGTLAGTPADAAGAGRPTAAAVHHCAAQPAKWMGCLVKADSAFGSLPVSSLALPGSHNAGTFNLDPQAFDTASGSKCSTYTAQDLQQEPAVNRWSETQDESITAQLNQGVRVIDLNVAYNGDGNPLIGWRVTQTQYSDWPLYDTLDQVAHWAKGHKSEMVIVDLRNVCADNSRSKAAWAGLFQNFAHVSDKGDGKVSIAKVAYAAGNPGSSFATTGISDVTGQGGGGHNVVVMLPSGLPRESLLTSKYHVTPVLTAPAGHGGGAGGAVPLATVMAPATPTSGTDVAAANAEIQSAPLKSSPALGSLRGQGLYEDVVAYDFGAEAQSPQSFTSLLEFWGGLVKSAAVLSNGPGSKVVLLKPWEQSLWQPDQAGAIGRNRIVASWGSRANMVLADGVEYRGFVPAVIALNAG
jgi:hypothetical protein